MPCLPARAACHRPLEHSPWPTTHLSCCAWAPCQCPTMALKGTLFWQIISGALFGPDGFCFLENAPHPVSFIAVLLQQQQQVNKLFSKQRSLPASVQVHSAFTHLWSTSYQLATAADITICSRVSNRTPAPTAIYSSMPFYLFSPPA